mmetsp:Transcript_14643/g.26522  ORF Transcript_14643/g.26522 Transcript_14643/m.26522 type:complete len:524 (-) Transcript_14643:129-1700(-)
MTITSGWSRGGSSVSDRIMGRMKMNLSFGSGGSTRNIDSSSSVGSRKSTGRFSRRRADARNVHSTFSVDGGGSSNLVHERSQSSRRYRSPGIASSMAGVDAMEEMDSNEAMTLKGQTFGRRHKNLSAPTRRQRKLNKGQPKTQTGTDGNGDDPVEYSLAELRTMSEVELGDAMYRAGVPPEDISSTLNEAGKIDTGVETIAADQQRKNLLVALFVNSGHVKLVPKDSNTERRSTLSSLKSDSVRDSYASSVKSSNSKDQSRKSKLEKIAELKTENSNMKRENKSLKKTVKKLLGQLTDVIKDKGELQNSLDEGGKEGSQKETSDDLPRSSLDSINEAADTNSDAKRPNDAENNETASGQRPPYDVVAHNIESGSIKSGNQSQQDSSSRHSIGSEKSLAKNIGYLKRKLKNEKEAHLNTKFRLQAELEILTNEVDGLQRELGLSLESLDNTKKRARESRESSSNLKHELRNASTKVKELTAEAEARDKLIETFSKILLQKVGLDGGEDGGLNVDNGEFFLADKN